MPKQTAESMAAAQKPAARKPAAKKAAPKGEGTAKKPAAKKTAARKPAAKKSAGGTRLVIVESPAKAKTIALTQAGVAQKDAVFLKVESDTENGVPVYEVEFVAVDFQFPDKIDLDLDFDDDKY